MKQLSLFQKMVASIVLLLFPVMALYTYFYYVSEQVVREEVHSRNLSRLEVTMNRLEADIWQLSQFLIALSIDSDVDKLRNIEMMSPYEAVVNKDAVQQKLLLYQQLSNMLVDVSVYLPDGERTISTMPQVPEQPGALSPSWTYVDAGPNNDHAKPYFIQHFQYPSQGKPVGNNVVIEARLYAESIRAHLLSLESSGEEAALFYNKDHHAIVSAGNHEAVIEKFNQHGGNQREGMFTYEEDDNEYVVTYVQSPSLGWALIDVVPLENVLEPIKTTRLWFYVTVAMLLLFGVAAAWLLYTQIHRPIDRLKDGILAFKGANYSVRMKVPKQKEFAIAMDGFNEMAEQIQTLIEQVLAEKIRSQEASLKLLQAQIDPHFLYNCLFYIKNMAKVNNTNAVEAMALHLGDYFRYRVKVEEEKTTIAEEIKLVENFLAIHALRKRRLHYDIAVPDNMNTITIPRLIIQPIVENAIVHAIENIEGDGYIQITGEISGDNVCRLTVENNGPKLGVEKINQLQWMLEEDVLSESYGMRNVHQRLRQTFAGRSGLVLSESELGGLKVEILFEQGVV